jgi:DNA-binding LytR/AlgR family response regulator
MPTDNNPPHSVEPNKLLARIPRAKRGDLISLTVMDHYVEVTTTRGKHLILMRFSDTLA